MKGILLVEDDRASRETLAYLLSYKRFDVRAASSAEEARGLLFGWEPEYAVLDVTLPGMRGDDFAALLHESLPNTKIIFLTGEFRLKNPERLRDGYTFLHKPVNPDGLLASLN